MSKRRARQRGVDREGFDGLLLVDKPSGPTSHDVVDRIRRTFALRKVGHGGTLDPMATGLLVILLGRGTKLSNHIMGTDKTYQGTLRLGVRTDTQDLDGEVIEERDCSGVTQEAVQAEMRARVGDLMQTPPMVSAVKKDGVPLYKLARKGQTIEREPRLIHVYAFEMLDVAFPDIAFRLRCTKGTYVRTLCDEIGEALGCGAHLAALRRTEAGPLSVDKALPLDQVLETAPADLVPHIVPIQRMVVEGMTTP
jgi:tRNA pseudouridine55 synthase